MTISTMLQIHIFAFDGITKKRNRKKQSKHNSHLISFEINNSSKDNIIDELNLLGINEATLFPELENQAKYLKKYYG